MAVWHHACRPPLAAIDFPHEVAGFEPHVLTPEFDAVLRVWVVADHNGPVAQLAGIGIRVYP